MPTRVEVRRESKWRRQTKTKAVLATMVAVGAVGFTVGVLIAVASRPGPKA